MNRQESVEALMISFRGTLVHAEQLVCTLMESILRDNAQHDVLDQLTSVRRGIHYALAHNGLALATADELNEPRDGSSRSALEALVIAREIAATIETALGHHVNVRSLDCAIETLDHALRRTQTAAVRGALALPRHGGNP